MNKKEKGLLCIPLIVSILMAIMLSVCMKEPITINNFDIIADNYNNFVSVLIGFLITTITIIIGFLDKKIIKIIVKNQKEEVLLANWILTILSGIISIFIILFLIASWDSENNIINKIGLISAIFMTINFIGYLAMALFYFFGIVIDILREDDNENKEMPKLEKDKIKRRN